MKQVKIREVEVTLWDKYKVIFSPHSDVNIIVGINGSGKTTLLSEMERMALKIVSDNFLCIYIPSIDNLIMRDKRKKETVLSQDLDSYIYDMKTGPSLMYYKMSMLDAEASVQIKIKERIQKFCDVVNNLFKDTRKF